MDISPSLTSWLILHTLNALNQFVAQVNTMIKNNAVSFQSEQLFEWSPSEALLHSLTSISKSICFKEFDATSLEQRNELLHIINLMGCLQRKECMCCRPLARMAVILMAELLVKVVEFSFRQPMFIIMVKEMGFDLSELVSSCIRSVVFTVTSHREEAFLPKSDFIQNGNYLSIFRHLLKVGSHLPFRLKQDHIGAVSLLKILSQLGSFTITTTLDNTAMKFLFGNNYGNVCATIMTSLDRVIPILEGRNTNYEECFEKFLVSFLCNSSEWMDGFFEFIFLSLGLFQTTKSM